MTRDKFIKHMSLALNVATLTGMRCRGGLTPTSAESIATTLAAVSDAMLDRFEALEALVPELSRECRRLFDDGKATN